MTDTLSQREPTSPDFTVKTWTSDVTFLLEGRPLYASKSVLALFSPVFNAMFGSQFQEREQDEVELPGKDYESFHEFLMCFYPNMQKPVTAESVYKVLPLAHEYQCTDLLTMCKLRMKMELSRSKTTKKTIEILALAITYNLDYLINACIKTVSGLGVNSVTFSELKELGKMSELKDAVLYVQNEILRMQMEKAEQFQTEMVRTCLSSDLNHNVIEFREDFTSAKGAQIKLSLKNVSQLPARSFESSPAPLWSFSVYLVAYFEKSSNQKIQEIMVAVVFENANESNAENWSSDVKVKLVLRNQLDGIKHKSFVATERVVKAEPGISCCTETVSALKRGAYLYNDQLDMVAYVLVNEPVNSEQ